MGCISHDPEVTPAPENLALAKERARGWARDRRKLKLGFRTYAESEVLKIVGNGK
jgi:hypothetical protein